MMTERLHPPKNFLKASERSIPSWRRLWEPTGQKIIMVEWIPFYSSVPKSQIHTILRLTTDHGFQGYSVFNFHYKRSETVSRALIGLDPGDPEAIVDYLNNLSYQPDDFVPSMWPGHADPSQYSHQAYVPADIAIWDLLGRIRNKPVHQLWGAKQSRIKLKQKHLHVHMEKFGTNTPGVSKAELEKDIRMFKKVRAACGPEMEIIADCHHAYTLKQALHVGRVLEALNYRHMESPMPELNSWMDRYAELQRQLSIPVCAPEILLDDIGWGGSLKSMVRWIESGAVRVPRPGQKIFGFTQTLWTSRIAKKYGLRCEIHNDADFTYFYDLQILATLPAEQSGQLTFYEPAPLRPYSVPWQKTPGLYIDHGYVPVPTTPGMGVEINWEYVDDHRCNESDVELTKTGGNWTYSHRKSD